MQPAQPSEPAPLMTNMPTGDAAAGEAQKQQPAAGEPASPEASKEVAATATSESQSADVRQKQTHIGRNTASIMTRLSVELKTRRSLAWQSGDVVDGLGGEDLGVAFHTRAAVDSGGPSSTRNQRALSRVFDINDNNNNSNFPTEDMLEKWASLRKIQVWYASTSSVAVHTERVVKCSGLFSFVYVLGVLGIEPACTPAQAGNVWARLGEPTWRFEAMLAVLSALNAFMYFVASIATRLVFGRVDPRKEEELTAVSDVLKSHARSIGLWLDVLSIFGALAEWIHLWEEPHGSLPTVAHWFMLLQLGKCWRVLSPDVSSQAKGDSSLFLRGVVWIFLQLWLFAHCMASFLMILGNLEMHWQEDSWVWQVRPMEVGCAVTYTEATYFAVLSLTSVGYNDVLITPRERALNTLFLLLAQLFTAKVCADLTWLTSTHNHWEAQNQAKQAQTWVALRKMEVPRILAKRVLAFQSYVANVHREDLAQSAFAGLSDNLIKELRLCAYRKLVIQAPFLREQNKDVIATIVGSLRDAVYLPADFIVRAGEKGRELFFIRRGNAAVFVGKDPPIWGQDQSVMSYTAGNYFGELAMLTGRPRAAWVMATTYSVCSALLYSDVEELGKEYPGAFTRMIHSIVQQFKLKPSMQWSEFLVQLHTKVDFNDVEEAFDWFCDHNQCEEELDAKAFDEALRRLKVPELDRKIFWASIDTDNSGTITINEFNTHVAPSWDSDKQKAMLQKRTSSRFNSGAGDSMPVRPLRQTNVLRIPPQLARDYGQALSPPPDLNRATSDLSGAAAPTPASARSGAADGQQAAEGGGPGAQATAVALELLAEVRRELAESREQAKRLTEEVRALQGQPQAGRQDGAS